MRRRLGLIVLAVTAMVTIAFLVPLGLVVKVVAADRAVSAADQESRSLAGVLAAVNDRDSIARVVGELNAGNPRQATVFPAEGAPIGASANFPARELVEARAGRAFTSSGPGDNRRVWVPVRESDGSVTAAVIAVPAAQVDRGVTKAWLVLGLVGLFILVLGVALADRLGRSVVAPIQELEDITERLRQGDLGARVDPRGPPEVADVGRAVNQLAGRIGDLIAQEREAAADLSHRLRTPLTVVQLEAESVSDPSERSRVVAAVGELTDAVTSVITEARQPRTAAAPSADLVGVVRGRLAFWSVLADDQGRKWEAVLPEGPCPVRVSADDLAAVVDSLLTNVFAHTPHSARFSVTVADSGAAPILRVDDDGPGFPHGSPRRGRSASGSSGLGLDIVRRSAQASGGSLRLSRSAKGGARVDVSFGRASAPVAAAATTG